MEPLTGSRIPRRRWAQILGTGATALLAAGTVASTAGAATSTNAPTGAFGSVAALGATSMEVQNPSSGQTTVNWTSSTQFSKTVTEAVSAITVGDCVTATGTASKKSKTTVAARDLSVSMPNSSGACVGTSTNGARGSNIGIRPGGTAGGFQFRSGSAGGPPGGGGGFPKGASPGNFRRQLANLSIASGKVTAVSASTLTISGISVSPGSFPKTSQSKSKKPPTPKVQTLKVTTSSSTPVSATQSAASTDLAVGDCVNAFGPAATNGSVTASTVRITLPVGGSCTGGFFKRTNGSGGGGGGGPAFFGGSGGA
ncbi:MAG TPA: DUF5666 domain-containing protein [Acidimicrobiales bacterium]|nr:DUF5666 domain-containing protein [Acidimicrobiales bacterium]